MQFEIICSMQIHIRFWKPFFRLKSLIFNIFFLIVDDEPLCEEEIPLVMGHAGIIGHYVTFPGGI